MMRNINFTIAPRPDIIDKNGKTPVFIRLYMSGKDKRFKIPNVAISLKNWDQKKNKVKKTEPFFNDYNLIIDKYSYDATKIILEYTAEKKQLTFVQFEAELYNKSLGTSSFYDFAENIIKSKYTKYNTIRNLRKHLNRMKEYRQELTFNDIDYDFTMNYKVYLEKVVGNAPASVSKALAVLKMFLNEAINRGIIKETPFKKIKIAVIKGKHLILTKEDLTKLIELHQNQEALAKSQKETLKAFLFSCFSGLRFGDLYSLRHNNIKPDGTIVFKEEKTDNETIIPLSEFAKSLIATNFATENQKIFNLSCNQVANRQLKEIANLAGINPYISFHYARRTYSTFLYNATGDLYLASELTGHKTINTTIKHYAQPLTDKRKDGIKALDEYILKK